MFVFPNSFKNSILNSSETTLILNFLLQYMKWSYIIFGSKVLINYINW